MNVTRNRIIGLAVAALWLLAGCDAFVSTEGRIKRAEDALGWGQFGKAAIELNKVVDKEPKNAAARLLLARLALRLADASGAEAAIKRASEAGAEPGAVEQLEVETLLLSGKASEASTRIQSNQLIVQPQRGVLLGRALLDQGKPVEALAAFDAALASDSKNGGAIAGKAEALAATNKLDEAGSLADAALAADEANWEAGLLKGRLLLARGDQKGGEGEFRKALGFMGRSANLRQIVSARAAVAEMALGKGDTKTAAEDVKELQRLAKGSPAAELLSARLSVVRGDRRDAAARLQSVLLAAPQMTPARMLLASVHVADGNLLQAEAQLQAVISEDPDNTEARKQLAQVRLQLKNPGGAASAITPALAADNQDPQLLRLMDAVQVNDSRSGETLVSLRRAYEGNPNSASLRLAYAAALLRAKRPADALKLVASNTPVGEVGIYWAIRFAATDAAQGSAAAKAEMDRLIAERPGDTALVLAAYGVLITQRDLIKAREVLLKGRQSDPRQVNLILLLSQVERSLGNSPAADKLLSDAVAQQPAVLQLRLALIESQAQRGDVETAITTLRAVDKLNDNADLQIVLARLELSRKNLANAQKALDRFVELAPANADQIALAGSLLLQYREFEAALARFQKAAEIAPSVSNYQIGIANAQLQLKQTAAARRAAERAAELDPKSIAPVALLVAMDVIDKKLDAAVQRADAWQKGHTEDPASYRLLGEALFSANRLDAAVKVHADLQKKSPTVENAIKLQQLQTALKDKNADQPLLDWLKSNPGDQRARMALANYYNDLANWPKAVAEYEKLVDSFPNDPAALNNLAWGYYNVKDKRALATAEKAYKLANAAPPVADTYGWILVEQGDLQRGLPVLQKAAEAQTEYAEIQTHYGVALGRAGQKKEGLAALEKAATLEKNEAKRAEVQKRIAELRGQL